MRRYLLISGAVALVVNLVVNALVGSALYAGQAMIPLEGDHSIAGDTVVGAFLIAFFTLLVVPPAARREVKSGKVRGGGRLRLPRRWPWLVAIVGGVISAVVVGVPAVAVVGKPLSHDAFLAFKICFAGAWGTLSAMLVAALAIAGEQAPPVDDRWSTAAVELAYPFDYVDKGGLAVTSKAHGCSGTPTWQLVVDGAVDPDAVRAALALLLERYPSLTTRVQALDAIPEYATRFRYAKIGPPGELYELVDLRARPGELEAVVHEVWNRHLDQFRDPPMTLTHVIERDDRCHLLFRQHHGIADGRAFIELLQDFARYLSGDRGDVTPVDRRGELEPLGLSAGTRAWYGLAGFGSLVRSIVRGVARPLAVLAQNESADYTGANGAVRWIVDDEVLARWRAAHKRIGASLNSLLTGAWFLANQRWHRAHGRKLGRVSASLVMETRPREGGFRSFANHLATLEAELPLDRELAPDAMVRSIQAQVTRQLATKRPIKRLVCERALVRGMPLDKLHALVFDAKRPAYNLNLSNLIPLDFPVLRGEGWLVDQVLITTPVTPRNGIVLTVIRYHGRLCFNFNYTASAATAAQTEELAQRFREALDELSEG